RPKPSRRRRLAIAATVGACVLALLWVFTLIASCSIGWDGTVTFQSPDPDEIRCNRRLLSFAPGRICFSFCAASEDQPLRGMTCRVEMVSEGDRRDEWYGFCLPHVDTPSFSWLCSPFWVLILPCCIARLWLRHGAVNAADGCTSCGYCLFGNVSGI